MSKDRSHFFSRMFFLGSLWNFGVGLTGIFFYDFSVRFLFGVHAAGDGLVAQVGFRFFMAAVVLFGAGYFMVSRDLSRNRGIVWLGLSGKLMVFFAVSVLFILTDVTIWFFLGAFTDLIFAVLFVLFLVKVRSQ